jgi:hypothetical protein
MRAASSPRQAEVSGSSTDARANAAGLVGVLAGSPPKGSALREAGFSDQELSVEKDESQKLQARTLDASTAPHCKHVFVTGVLRCGRFLR